MKTIEVPDDFFDITIDKQLAYLDGYNLRLALSSAPKKYTFYENIYGDHKRFLWNFYGVRLGGNNKYEPDWDNNSTLIKNLEKWYNILRTKEGNKKYYCLYINNELYNLISDSVIFESTNWVKACDLSDKLNTIPGIVGCYRNMLLIQTFKD